MKRETFSPLQAQEVAAAFAKHHVDLLNIRDIIASKRAANRARDAVELPLLEAFREVLRTKTLIAGRPDGGSWLVPK